MKKLLIILALALTSCSDSDNDCEIQRNHIIDKHIDLIDQAREHGDSYQIHLLIEQRNKQLSKLDC